SARAHREGEAAAEGRASRRGRRQRAHRALTGPQRALEAIMESDPKAGTGDHKPMTVAEAGRKGGLTVRNERGHAFYEEIGRKGGQKVRELINRGKQIKIPPDSERH